MAATEPTTAVKKVIDSILSHSVVREVASQANLDGAGAAASSGGPHEDGPTTKDPTTCTHLLEVKWSDGSVTSEPVNLLARDPDHLLAVVRYLHQHNLLLQAAISGSSARKGDGSHAAAPSSSSWSQQLPEHVRRQFPIVLLPDKSHPTYANDLQHLDVIHRALNKGFPSLAKAGRKRPDDTSYRPLREGAFEIFVAEAKTKVPTAVVDGDEEEENADEDGMDRVVKKGTGKYKSMILKLKKQVGLCFPKRIGRLEDQSIKALTSFARRTAENDPSLADVKQFAITKRTTDSANQREDDTPAADAGAVTPVSSEDGHESGGDSKVTTDKTKEDDKDEDVVFGSYSCLVSRAGTKAQFRHVDAHKYERQYSMAISGDGSRPTVTHIVVDELETPDQVMKVWIELVRAYPKVYPLFNSSSDVLADDATIAKVAESILASMKENADITKLIANYGMVLGRPSRTVEICGTWSPGTVVSLPGGNVHHAPPNEKFRAILFFTSSPAGMDTYDVDAQFSGPTLAASIMLDLWDEDESDDDTAAAERLREFLRRVLYVCVLEDPAPDDFTRYLHDNVLADNPIRQIMVEAHAHKLSLVGASAAAAASASAAPSTSSAAAKRSAPAKALPAAETPSPSSSWPLEESSARKKQRLP